MATSGTVGNTRISVTKLVEHAVRRCGLPVETQTSETLDIARDNLFTMLLASANRGYYLWCVEKQYIGLIEAKAVYDTPVGTVDLSDVVYSMPTRVTGTDTTLAQSVTTVLDTEAQLKRVGLKFTSITVAETVTVSALVDSVWTTVLSQTKTDWDVDTWYWFDLDTLPTSTEFKVATTLASTVAEFYLASEISDLPISPLNRDTYSVLSNKYTSARPVTNYMVEKKVNPTITLWPLPNNSYDHLTVWVHRQIQDVGAFTNDLEIPNRWYEAVIWQLAFRLSMELRGVDPSRTQILGQMADKYLIEAEKDEVDGMPTYMQPNIGVYSA